MNELQLKIEKLKEKIDPDFWKSIDVDEGWYQIVIDCDAELSAVDPHHKILQIKEKFGGLRYYIKPSETCHEERRLGQIITKYEEIASKTCEATGQPGVLMKSIGGWRKTLNPDYAASKMHYGKYSVVEQSEIKLDDNREV
jgi:hypothetical protein